MDYKDMLLNRHMDLQMDNIGGCSLYSNIGMDREMKSVRNRGSVCMFLDSIIFLLILIFFLVVYLAVYF
jgi:hypothetical protein